MVPTVHLCSGRMDGQSELSKGVPIHCEGKGGKAGGSERKTAARGLLLVPNVETERPGVSRPVLNAREVGKRDGVPAVRLIVKRGGIAR